MKTRSRQGSSYGRPVLSDLRDSGSIEQDADMVLFIHRPALLGLSEDGIDRAELIIAKNRAGEMGIIPLRFNGDQVRFKEDTGSLSDYASAVPVESAMNSYNITPRPSEGYSPFDHFESGGE